MKMRTFLAAEISEEVRKRLLDMIRNFGIDKGVKWVRGENMHVTIYFFGNVIKWSGNTGKGIFKIITTSRFG